MLENPVRRRPGARARRDGDQGREARERVHGRDPGGRGRGHRRGPHRLPRPGRPLHRRGHAGHRCEGAVHRARVPRRAHPRGIVHDGRGRIRARRRAARHHGHLHGPARDLQRARPRRREGDGGGRAAHAAQDDDHHPVVRARRARLRGHRFVHRPGRRGRDDGMAERRGARR